MIIIDFLTFYLCKKTLILGNAFYGTPGRVQVPLQGIMQKEGPFVIGPGQEVTTPITSSAMLTWSGPDQ